MEGIISPAQGLFPNNVTQARRKLGLEIDLKLDYGASGSNQNTTGTINAGTNILLLSDPIDFVNGQGISIIGAGPGPFQTDGVTPLESPASLTVTPTGVPGATTYTYWCAAIDSEFGVTAAVSETTNTGNAVLSESDYNALSVPPVAGAAGYVWWGDESNPENSRGLLGITEGNTFNDIGMGTVINAVPPGSAVPGGTQSGLYYLPMTPPSSPVGDRLMTTVLSGGGTNTLTLKDYAANSVSSTYVGHSDYQAFINALTEAITYERKLHIPNGVFVIDKQVYTDVSPGASHMALNVYGEGNSFSSSMLDFYPVMGVPWTVDNPSDVPIYGLIIENIFVSLYSRNGPLTVSASGFDPAKLNAYYDSNINILVTNAGPCLKLSHIYVSTLGATVLSVYEHDVLSPLPLELEDVEAYIVSKIVAYGPPLDSTVVKLANVTAQNVFFSSIINGAIEIDGTCGINTFVSPYISTLTAALVNSGVSNVLVNPHIVSIDAVPDPSALMIIGGPYDNTTATTGKSVANLELTDTNPTTVLSYTVSSFDQALIARLTFDIVTAPTKVTAVLSWTNPNTGAQTYTWEDGAASLPVDTYVEVDVPILAAAGSTVTITLTAGTANQVFVTAGIEKQV